MKFYQNFKNKQKTERDELQIKSNLKTMDSIKQFELQQQLKENSAGIMDTINKLHKWEKEMKRNSAANSQTKKNEVSLLHE